jgi:hypothetical protein
MPTMRCFVLDTDGWAYLTTYLPVHAGDVCYRELHSRGRRPWRRDPGSSPSMADRSARSPSMMPVIANIERSNAALG